jgi:thiol:disulfide interchange protein
VAPPPPPVAVTRPKRAAKTKTTAGVAKAKPNLTPRPPASATREELVALPAAAPSSDPASSTLLFLLLGLTLALIAVGVSLVPVWSVPVGIGVRLERNRQTIALTGLAIGLACAFVGFLDVLAGR